MSEDRPPERERLRGVVASLLGLRHRELDELDAGIDDAQTHPLVDAATRIVGSTLERWTRGSALRRLLGGVERDVLTRPGEWVALEARHGLAGKFNGTIRFLLDGELVAEVPVGEGNEARAMIRAPKPGLYRVAVELGTKLRQAVGPAVLQVVDDRAVVLIDAEILLPAEGGGATPSPLGLLRSLLDAGFELAYFDVHEKDRSPAIHEALERLGLPPAACLVYATESNAVERLGLDFARVFAVAAVHRLRAKGVPIGAVVSPRFRESRPELGSVSLFTPGEARRAVARPEGLSAQHEAIRRFVAEREAAEPQSWRLDQATASRLIAGNELVAELDNQRARERVFELLEGARSSIHLQVYIIRPSDFAEELIVQLIRRVRAGVTVRVMVDALYSDQEVLGRVNPLLQSLEYEPGIEVLALHPIESRRDVDVSRLKKRDHRKLIIVDGERAIVSGRNASDEYYRGFAEVPVHDHTHHERIPWLDAHVEVAGPLVSEIQRCFLDTWLEEGGGAPGEGEVLLPPLAPRGSAAARLVVHHGLVDANGLALYEALLDLAEDHVYIVNDFPIVSTLERAIARLLARGVRVELLTGNAASRRDDGSLFPAPFYRTLFEHMVKARLEPLMLAGVKVYEFATAPSPKVVARGGRVRPYVHAKLMSVDGRVCSIGSANLDATASFWESEANVVIEDEGFTGRLEAELRELIAGSFALDPRSEYWKRERAQRAVVGTLWPGSLYS